jgi:hypothetical protein
MKRILLSLFFAIFNSVFVFSQSVGSTMYVAVKTIDLKSSTGVFAGKLGILNLGEAVTLIRINGKWAEVRTANSLSGWVAMSGLTSRRIMTNDRSVLANEIALAGKGFSPEMEVEYRKNGLDYSLVDMMEELNIVENDLQEFIDDGRLTSGIQSTFYPFFFTGRTFYETEESATPEDEYYLGRAVAANILATYRPYTPNTELTLYLNRICQTLVVNSSRPVIYDGYHLLILDSPGFNAFASPGGHIFITRGLVEAAPSEDALAGIIAHELAHVILRHSTSIIDDMKINEEISSMAAEVAAIAGERNSGDRRILAFRNSVNVFFDTMMRNGYSQPQEFEADKYAMALLAASGYDPGGLLEMLRILQRGRNGQGDSLNSTHPSPSERIANLENEIYLYRVTDTRSLRVPRFYNN